MAKKQQFYKQCRYERFVEDGRQEDTAWIPENLAKVGKTIEIDALPGGVWTVVAVGPTRRTGTYLKDKERVSRKYIQSTDI